LRPCCEAGSDAVGAVVYAEQFVTVLALPVLMPVLPLLYAEQLVTVQPAPVNMPLSVLPLASTSPTRQLIAARDPRSTPVRPQLRTEPFTTAMFVKPVAPVRTPSTEPLTPTQVKPVEIEGNAADDDRDAGLTDHAGHIARQVVRTGLRNPEEAVGVAGVLVALTAIRGSTSLSVFIVPLIGPAGGVRLPPDASQLTASRMRGKTGRVTIQNCFFMECSRW